MTGRARARARAAWGVSVYVLRTHLQRIHRQRCLLLSFKRGDVQQLQIELSEIHLVSFKVISLTKVFPCVVSLSSSTTYPDILLHTGEPRPLDMKRDDRQKLIRGPDLPIKRKGVSFVSIIWVLFTFVVIASLAVAAGFPYWIVNRIEGAPNSPQSRDLNVDYSALVRVDLGLYYLCYQLYSGSPACGMDGSCNATCSDRGYCGCVPYLSYNPPSNFSTSDGLTRQSSVFRAQSVMDFVWLFAASIIYAFGVFLLLLSLIIGVIAFCKPRFGKCSLFLTAFVFQLLAGKNSVVALDDTLSNNVVLYFDEYLNAE